MSQDWYYRRDHDEEWFGPMSYRDANSQARRCTLPKFLKDHIPVKYAQVGTIVGGRGGDPVTLEAEIRVVYLYANGRQYLSGHLARYNADKVTNE